jgi:hypothetical protein
MSLVDETRIYWRFASGLRAFLKEPVTLEQAHRIIRARLQHREDNVLASVKTTIYERSNSPYLKLLQLAGCEYGDLERMVRSDGIETSLRRLYHKGVYITLEGFKGSKEITRGSASFPVRASDFDAPMRSDVLGLRSGATRSSGTKTAYDFEYLSSYTVHRLLLLTAAGAFGVPHGFWMPILPGGGPRTLLTAAKAGLTPLKWFSQVGQKGTGASLKDRMTSDYIVYAGRLFGARWPKPEYVSLSQAEVVARWVSTMMKRHGGCHLTTYPSSAVRVCQAASRNHLDIAGARFDGGGEPFTEAKRAEMESVGASYCPSYASVETGIIGNGCIHPLSAGDVHFLNDAFALIQHTRSVPHSSLSVEAFLFTTLLASSPKVMLNTETGDYGSIGDRACGCDHEKLGLTTHITDIRGFDKLTAEGMTLVGTDLVRVVEEVLPARFGGSSTDYQILEEEDEAGQTRMNVLVSPGVGDIDESELIRSILAGLPQGGITPSVWSHAGTFKVKRVRPFVTARGKLMPLHIAAGRARSPKDSH